MNAITKEEQNALTLPERAAVALNTAEYEIKLRELLTNSVSIVTVTNKAGRDECHAAYMVLKNARCSITNLSEDTTEDAKAFTKAVKAEALRLIAITEKEEDRLEGLRDDWDEAEKARKAALIAAERARAEAIQAAIQAIRDIPLAMIGKSAQDISRCIAGLVGTVPDESFEEFIEQAKVARYEALDKLAAAETAQRAVEIEAESQRQEAARVAAEAEELRIAEAARQEAERIANAAQRAENERVANDLAIAAKRLADQEAAQALVAKQLADKAAANLRAENEARDTQVRIQREAQQKNQMALSQIEAIRHQAVIAEVGRSPYVKGGDAASYLFVLAETRSWVIDDEQFGVMTASAQMVKDSTIVMLEQGLASYIAADHVEALIDNEQFDADLDARHERGRFVDSLAQEDAAAQLARCTETAKAMLTNGRSLVLPESCCARDARINEGFDKAPTDGEILDVYVENFGGTREQAIERLALFDAVMARAELMVAAQ